MQDIWDIAWHRFNIIQTIVGDTISRAIAVLFYFTILMPFGIGYSLTSDPLREKEIVGKDGKTTNTGQAWHERDPVPTDLDSARLQG